MKPVARLAIAATAAAIAVPSGTAHAERTRRSVERVDISSVKDELVVLRGDDGQYIAVLPFALNSEHFYYGNERELRQQHTFLSSSEEGELFERYFWAPREENRARLTFRDGRWFVQCRDGERRLAVAAAVEADRVLSSARFLAPNARRGAYLLARDSAHRYYLIDRRDGARGSSGFRLFRGHKRRMRPVRLRHVIRDSEGEIFVSARGDIHVQRERGHRPRLTLHHRGAVEELVTVPVDENLYLIYEELGVYKNQRSTPCDSPARR